MKIGIIGMGFVGGAVAHAAASNDCELSTLDKYKMEKTQNMGKFEDTLMAFVCVPTPTVQSHQDLTELHATMLYLNKLQYKGAVVIKSTVLPGTTSEIAGRYPRLRLVHNPEFLNQKTANDDFIGQVAVLISGRHNDTKDVDKFYRRIGCSTSFHHERYEVTEWAKYIHNCCLPIQLSFLNEVHSLIGNQEIFNEAVRAALPFGNVNLKHHSVPGPDGKKGWGGACFSKDTMALSRWAAGKAKIMNTLLGAIVTNNSIRGESK